MSTTYFGPMFFGSRFGAIKPVKVCEPGSARPRPRAWREIIGDPARADANLDRLVHNARRIEFSRASLRRARHSELKTARPKSTPDEKPSSANKAGPLAASFRYGGGIGGIAGRNHLVTHGRLRRNRRVRTRYPAAGLRSWDRRAIRAFREVGPARDPSQRRADCRPPSCGMGRARAFGGRHIPSGTAGGRDSRDSGFDDQPSETGQMQGAYPQLV